MNIGYFIENSPHYLPTVLPLVQETGGIIITFSKKAIRCIKSNKIKVFYFHGYKHLLNKLLSLQLKIIVHPSFTFQYFKEVAGLKHVQVFHGTSDKPFNFHKSLRFYDMIAVSGPKLRDSIIEKNLAKPDKIVLIGYPKIDNFFNSGFDTKHFKKQVGLDESRKTVLYSPTWDDPDGYSSFSLYISSLINNLKELNLIIKTHPNTFKYRPWKILKAYILKFKRRNCFLYPGSDSILPFMAISDILITDISSVSHEYLPFKKPMVFLNPRPGYNIPEEHTWIWRCGDVVENGKNIYSVIKDNLKNPMKYKIEREKALKQIFLDFDGKSALRFKEQLQRFFI